MPEFSDESEASGCFFMRGQTAGIFGAAGGNTLSMKKKRTLLCVLGGACVGFINGLIGAGGGTVAVPMLKKLGLEPKQAHAGSIAIIWPLSAISAALYLHAGEVRLTDALGYIPAGAVGAVIGAWLLGRLPDKWVRRMFAVFMIWAGVRLMLR